MISAEKTWRRREAGVCARVNLAIVLELWLRLAAGLTLVAAVAMLLGRVLGFAPRFFVIGWLVVLVGSLAVAAWVRREEFWRVGDGLRRLEIAGRLRGGLSTASAGVTAWPEAEQRCDAALRWRLGKVGMPLVLATLLALAAWWVPLPPPSAPAHATPTVPPMAWQQVEKWIGQLRKDEIVQPESLEGIEQQLHSLQQQPPAQWYSHASLEAGASLQARTEQSLRALGQELAHVKAAADAARQSGLANSEAAKEAAARAGQALAQLDAGALNPSSGLADAMRKLADSGDLRPLDASQLGGVCEALGRGIAGVEKCLGPGSCKFGGEGEDEIGRGGITRGPGEAPLGIGEASPPIAGNREAMESDPRRAALGDVVREQISAPETDGTASSRVGGAIGSAGQGGEAVARQSLVPAEGEILKRYFK